MNLIALTEKLIAERGYGDEMLANLTAMIDADIAEMNAQRSLLMQVESVMRHRIEELVRRKEELATEFATRRASLSALIGEEGAANV